MWYSGGEQYEPNAIGYATSQDGLKWTKHENNPIFQPDPKNAWEKDRVTACQVISQGDWHLMFYIGFRDVDHAQIGLARSRDGITGWQRHPANPIIRPGQGPVGPRRRLQAVRDLRRPTLAALVQRPQGRRRADRPGHPRGRRPGLR